MLLTRCPACHTTFRITDEALRKAGGRVRCGRCATVFDARAELREEHPAESTAAAPGSAAEPPQTPAAEAAIASAPAAQIETAPADNARVTAEDAAIAALVAQIERGGDAQTPLGADDALATPRPMEPSEIDAVLAGASAVDLSAPEWIVASPRRSRGWYVAAALALVALATQLVHHFRDELALNTLIGPVLQDTYAALGAPLTPRWDLTQYRIVEWVAAAEPNALGRGSLRISARVQNGGPRAQPFPHIRLELQDRWQESIGSRVFPPEQYLQTPPHHTALMAPGETAAALLDVLDPGPDASGFELDVCIEIDTALRCSAEQVFD